ncbi:septation ring formation regulator EzrA [human gut metagenome]|uniref:Septation ring formation regulator EzrA n=1 Tax=human gut metagenome TaxID=408170 RepID=K1SCB8_9ZZZZ|nr:septation ring formation regulator EzrA [Clostridium sp. CAG:417]
MKNNVILYILIFLAIFITFFIVTLIILKKSRLKKYKNILDELDLEKNLISSIPISLELSKVEPIIKNEDLESKYKKWEDKSDVIKNERIPKIDDMLIDIDTFIEKRDFENCNYRIAKTELEIYKVREASESLLEEIKEITLSDEKYRSIVTKLKTKYRKLNSEYQEHSNLYDEMQDAITLQLENIEKNFLGFESAMENNEYTEVVHIVKALDAMIEHMGIVIKEVPDLILMAKEIIPKRIKEVDDVVKEMEEKGYPLEYLNIDYNVEESRKNINTILDKIRVLNLEDCMFELRTILDYFDSLFIDFEKERLSRKVYEESEHDFAIKLKKTEKVVNDVFEELETIKNNYDLRDEDIDSIEEDKKILVVIQDDYKKLLAKLESKSTPYSSLHKEIEELTVRLKNMSDNLDVTLNSLGNMYDDEQRAREQLIEIEEFLQNSKRKIRSYKLPVITDNYFVELSEANDAIKEVIKELEKKPIVIKTLNTRVDTARDLVLKLYNTTNEIIKTAELAENCMVYGNRFRSSYTDIDRGLDEARKSFFKGDYKKSLDVSIKAISLVDKNFYQELVSIYDK